MTVIPASGRVAAMPVSPPLIHQPEYSPPRENSRQRPSSLTQKRMVGFASPLIAIMSSHVQPWTVAGDEAPDLGTFHGASPYVGGQDIQT